MRSSAAVTRRLTLWLLNDGKPGHENQSLGLAEAIGRRVETDLHSIQVAGKRGMIARVRAALGAGSALPKPDFILGAGHSTHLPLLWLARKWRARSIVLMKPSLPLSWFDLCLVPEHDFSNGGGAGRAVLTRGAINRVVPGNRPRSGKLILIGGPSRTHGWDGGALLGMLEKATDRGGWDLSDSRRTPGNFIEEARQRLTGVRVFSHAETQPGWVQEKLRDAKEVWVTEDSVSMIYEALTSGARVGLLPLPRQSHTSRVIGGIDSLVAGAYLTPFAKWLETGRIAAPPEALREAERCAEIVLTRFFPQ